jgi:hypothetical protein
LAGTPAAFWEVERQELQLLLFSTVRVAEPAPDAPGSPVVFPGAEDLQEMRVMLPLHWINGFPRQQLLKL